MTRTGKVVVITGPRRVEVVERDVPDPGADQVLIRTHVSGISAGTEMNVHVEGGQLARVNGRWGHASTFRRETSMSSAGPGAP